MTPAKVNESDIKRKKSIVLLTMTGTKENTLKVCIIIMSNIKVFAMQDSPPAKWTNTTHCLDPYDTDMDQRGWTNFFHTKVKSNNLNHYARSKYQTLYYIISSTNNKQKQLLLKQ